MKERKYTLYVSERTTEGCLADDIGKMIWKAFYTRESDYKEWRSGEPTKYTLTLKLEKSE